MLKNFWHVLALSSEVERKPTKAVCLGQPFVLYRTRSGDPVVLSDLCVHRGAELSRGKVEGDCVVCPYHGWRYQQDGACDRIPANLEGRTIPRKARVDSYPVVERYGFVWAFLGDLPEEERPPIPDWPEFEDPSFRPVYGEFRWNANYERVLENGIDVAHTPFVHGGSFGNPDKPQIEEFAVQEHAWGAEIEVTMEPQQSKGLWSRLYRADKPAITTRNAWWLPNLIRLEVNLPLGKMVLYDANIPFSETETLTKWVMLRNFFTGRWADGDARRRTMRIFRQDQVVVENQRPELLPYDLSEELHVRSDAHQVAYRRRRRELLEAGWGIENDQIPSDAPSTTATVIPSPARREVPELARAWVHRAAGRKSPDPASSTDHDEERGEDEPAR